MDPSKVVKSTLLLGVVNEFFLIDKNLVVKVLRGCKAENEKLRNVLRNLPFKKRVLLRKRLSCTPSPMLMDFINQLFKETGLTPLFIELTFRICSVKNKNDLQDLLRELALNKSPGAPLCSDIMKRHSAAYTLISISARE